MAVIIVLKHKETGRTQSKYSVDAREFLASEEGKNWEFHRRLGRTAKMVESGVATQEVGGDSKAVEFHGESVMQEDARKAVEPVAPDPLSASVEEKTQPEAPRGARGGGKQEPAKAKSDDK